MNNREIAMEKYALHIQAKKEVKHLYQSIEQLGAQIKKETRGLDIQEKLKLLRIARIPYDEKIKEQEYLAKKYYKEYNDAWMAFYREEFCS
jgi:hypothetical protein